MKIRYYCDNCGHIFNEDEAEITTECIGEAWGVPQYEREMVCPRCRCGGFSEYNEDEDEEEDDE